MSGKRNYKLIIRNGCHLSLAALLLTACEVGPDYQKPHFSLSANWLESKTPNAEKPEAVQMDWWKNFNDPVLDGIIAHALAQNYDLKIAEARITEARASVASARADLFPVVGADGSATREANEIAFGSETFPKPFNTFQLGFDASWELDLFGGNKRALESAFDLFKASKANRDDLKVSMLAEVARDYVTVRKLQAEIVIAQDSVANEESNEKIEQQLFQVGSASEVAAITARTTLLQAQSQLVGYQSQLAASEYALDLLLGEKPGYVKTLVADVKAVPVADKNVVLMAPVDVIEHRPDVRAAEKTFAASNAEIGVAKARLFPDISLSGFFGLFSTNTNTLFQASSKAWNVGASLNWPLLNFGKLSAGVQAVKAQQEEALAAYKKSVNGALVDVESSLSSYNKDEENRMLTDKSVSENQHAVDIADARYKTGVTSLTEEITAKRTFYMAQTQSAEATAASAQGFIAVYKSVGGGWKVKKEEQAPKKKEEPAPKQAAPAPTPAPAAAPMPAPTPTPFPAPTAGYPSQPIRK